VTPLSASIAATEQRSRAPTHALRVALQVDVDSRAWTQRAAFHQRTADAQIDDHQAVAGAYPRAQASARRPSIASALALTLLH